MVFLPPLLFTFKLRPVLVKLTHKYVYKYAHGINPCPYPLEVNQPVSRLIANHFLLFFWSGSGGLNNRAKLINHISCRRGCHAWWVRAYTYILIVMNERRLAVIGLIGPKIGDGPFGQQVGATFIFISVGFRTTEALRFMVSEESCSHTLIMLLRNLPIDWLIRFITGKNTVSGKNRFHSLMAGQVIPIVSLNLVFLDPWPTLLSWRYDCMTKTQTSPDFIHFTIWWFNYKNWWPVIFMSHTKAFWRGNSVSFSEEFWGSGII